MYRSQWIKFNDRTTNGISGKSVKVGLVTAFSWHGVHCPQAKPDCTELHEECKILEEVDGMLVTEWKFYKKSPKRILHFLNVSEALECELLRPQ
jgi:hypothetical protein